MRPNISLVDEAKAEKTLHERNAQTAWTQYCILRRRDGKSPGCHMRDFWEWWDIHTANRQLAYTFVAIEPTREEGELSRRALRLLQIERVNFARTIGAIRSVDEVNRILPKKQRRRRGTFFIRVSSSLSEEELNGIYARVMAVTR